MGAYPRDGRLFECGAYLIIHYLGCTLIRVGHLFDNPLSRVDAYSRGALNRSISVLHFEIESSTCTNFLEYKLFVNSEHENYVLWGSTLANGGLEKFRRYKLSPTTIS